MNSRFLPVAPTAWDLEAEATGRAFRKIEDPNSCERSDGKVIIETGYRYFAHSLCIPTERPPSVFG